MMSIHDILRKYSITGFLSLGEARQIQKENPELDFFVNAMDDLFNDVNDDWEITILPSFITTCGYNKQGEPIKLVHEWGTLDFILAPDC